MSWSVRTGPTDLCVSTILKRKFSMRGKVQFIFSRSMTVFFCALFLMASFTGHLAWSQKTVAKATQDYTHNVDPFIGVDWGGNTFVGAALPFGMVKLGPDMETFDQRASGFGYSSHGEILGFSHLHLSGAQGK